MQSIEKTIISHIYARGRGWAFSRTDFARLGSSSAIDLALHRLERKGTIRRVIRGLYDYPPYSTLLGREMSPDVDSVAHALARKFGWRIQPSGTAAQNLLGLSTQVPVKFIYLSDGPKRKYQINGNSLEFEHAALKETSFSRRQSGLIVQALRSFGEDRITPDIISKIRHWLDPSLRSKVLKDTQTAASWIYAAIQQICREDDA